MGEKLKNAPIVEVSCEFRFSDQSDDLTIYGIMAERLGSNFKKRGRKEYQNLVFEKNGNKLEPKVNQFVVQQFEGNAGNTLVQVGKNVLMINKLRPYSTWEQFAPTIKDAFNKYIEVTNLKELARIGLRYINKINFDKDIEINKYFAFRPQFSTQLGQEISSFISGVVLPRNANRDNLKIELTNVEADSGHKDAVILDIDCFTIDMSAIKIDTAISWVENAHDEVEKAFFACITPELQELLNK